MERKGKLMRTGNRLILPGTALLLAGLLAWGAVAGAAPSRGRTVCDLPRLTGTPLNVVRQLLPRLGCRLGSISRAASISIDRNAVITTRPTAGRYRRNRVIGVVISGGPAWGFRGPGDDVTGSGTNDDPFTVPKCTEFDSGQCQVIFRPRYLSDFLGREYVPAYRCPADRPWLLNKTVTKGRIVPPGVLFAEEEGTLGVSITGVSTKVGKEVRVANKVYSYDYATGTKTGFPNSSVTEYNIGGARYRIWLYCTDDLKQANLVAVRG
jgi:hypothetical protein